MLCLFKVPFAGYHAPFFSPMKLSRLLAVTAFLPLAALGQASPPEAGPAQPGTTAKDAAATVPLPAQPASPGQEKPIQLIPDNVPNISKPGRGRGGSGGGDTAVEGAATPGPSNTFRAEEDLKVRVRMRQARTHVLNEPITQEEWDAAHRVKTDPERRALLKIYYTNLYDRMLKYDSSLAERIHAQKTSTLLRLRYPRLEPDSDEDQSTLSGGGPMPEPGIPPAP